MLKIGVLKEPSPETRVSLVPEVVASLTKMKVEVVVERDAGALSFFSDADYQEAGAQIAERGQVIATAGLLASMHPVAPEDLAAFSGILIGVYQPLYFPERTEEWRAKGLTVFSLDLLPRTTRAQAMDVLSSQANIAGYKAVLLAANRYPRYFPMFMTAAGSVKPAKVLILGAGVAGLQAIATARRLGAVVEVFDTRPQVKEEVMSLGARFVEVEGASDASAAGGYAVEQSDEFKRRQQQKIAEHVRSADVVVTTAQIFGKKAPVLITEEMISSMKKGSVIVDLAAATGGNTALTVDREEVQKQGVVIVGASNLPSTMPADASKLYSKNVFHFLKLLVDAEGRLQLPFDDELVSGACLVHEGKIVNPMIQKTFSSANQ